MENINLLEDIKQNYGGIRLAKVSFVDSYRSTNHRHEDVDELIYILSGEGIITVNEEEKELRMGDILFIKAKTPHLVEGKLKLECLAIHLHHQKK